MSYLFIEQDINKLRKEIFTTKKHFYKRLIDQCQLYFYENLPEEHPKASTTYMGMAIANLSLAYLINKQRRYLDESRRWISAAVNYPHWGNAFLVDVDLSAAWILFGLGIAYDWLKDDLPVNEKKALADKMLLQGKRMYDFKVETEGSGWSTNYFQNHNWINLTGLSTAGYALRDEFPYAQDWIDAAKRNFEYVYQVMAPDGSDFEGVSYWRYGAMWLFVYAHLIREREGIDYFKQSDFLKNTFFYRLYQAAPNLEEQINFGDAHDRRSGHSTAIYYKVAAEYRNGYAQKLGNLVSKQFLYREAYQSKVKPGILCECFFELLFYDPEVKEESFDQLPLTRYFPDLGLFVKRSSWDEDATHFSFKCGCPGGRLQWEKLWELKRTKNYNCFGLGHQHPDNNSFILNAHNTFYATDDGYNRSVKASDHNVVIVDGAGYEDEGQNNIWKNYTQDMIADIIKYDASEAYIYICGEASKVYQKQLKLNMFKRHVITTDAPYIVMIDELASELEHIYTWIMYSDFYPIREQNRFVYEGPYGKLYLYHFSNTETNHTFVDNNIRAILTPQEPEIYTENKMKGLYISNLEKQKKVSFLTVLLPAESEDEFMVEELALEGGYGVRIQKDDFEKIYLYCEKEKIIYNNEAYSSKITLIQQAEGETDKVIGLTDDSETGGE